MPQSVGRFQNEVEMSQCIIICGMHRAGTSFVSRIFYEWGVYLGENLGTPDMANAEGEYENREFVKLNGSLLANHGGTWNYPVMVEDSDPRAKILIDKHKRELWGWKDNRTAFTFKVSEPFLENPLFVICKRNRDAVIQSLARTHFGQFREATRNPTYYGELYDKYYAAIDYVSKGYPSIVINYEEMTKVSFFNPKLRHFE